MTFSRGKGKPRNEGFAFSTPDAEAAHTLRVTTGPARRVTSAWIFVNGALVLDPRSFHGFTRAIERPIEVAAENELAVRLAGKRGSSLTVQVFAIDALPPRFVDVFPPDGSVVSEPQATLVVTLEDALSGATSLRCGEIEATPVDGDFACTVPLEPGPNSIELVASDACGNESRSSVTIVFDPPPVVSITSPEDGAVIVRGPVVVTGTVDDPGAVVTVNGTPATGFPDFSATVPVSKGANTLVAVARDAAGGEGTDSVEITVLAGTTGPTVSIASPKPGFLLGGPRPESGPAPIPVLVRGSVRAEGGASAASTPSVLVNGVGASVTPSSTPGALCSTLGVCNWAFQVSLPLDPADNPQRIEAVATDRFGQTDADAVPGNVDECVIDGADGYAVVGAAAGQSNRCHKIDGCSAPFPDSFRQDPTGGTLGRRSTAFGKDTSKTDFDPHGLAPRDDLPCNHHDVCYQTCGSDKVTCDDTMFRDMQAVCRAAYPEATCPYLPNLIQCDRWKKERDSCYAWARRYRAGLAADKWVDDRFGQRQAEFCWP